MGFAEALSDDGSLTGRGHPWVRGLICGAMTALGALGTRCRFCCAISARRFGRRELWWLQNWE